MSSSLTNLLRGPARLRGALDRFATPTGTATIAVPVVRAQPVRRWAEKPETEGDMPC
ncbi:hypothetical protein ACFPU0_10925 [Pseudomonas sp. GCM10022186]|uniref:hypothetical protein n=1 Tax=Pseudomonas sp. GCM10022186 TaxID=3252650 RepID=UPI003623BA8F